MTSSLPPLKAQQPAALGITLDPEPPPPPIPTASEPILLPPLPGPTDPNEASPKLAGYVALAATGCLALLLCLPSIIPFFGIALSVWSDSVVHVTYEALNESGGQVRGVVWLMLGLAIATGVALLASAAALAGRSKLAGWWVVLAGGLAIATGLTVPHYFGSYRHAGFTPWAILGAGVVEILAGAGILGRRHPAGSPTQGFAMVGVLGLIIAGAIGIPSSLHSGASYASSYSSYSGPTTEDTTPDTTATDPTDDDTTTTTTVTDGSTEALSNTWTVTETEPGGYTFTVQLAAGAPEHITSGMSQGSLTFDSTCDANDQTDAVIPATLTMTNSTSGFTASPVADLEASDAISGIDAGFDDGAECETDGLSTNSTNPLASGDSTTLDMFIVLSDYFTPDNPSGDPSVLDGAYLTFEDASDSADDTTATPQSITGPGVQSSSSEIELPLSGQATLPDDDDGQ